MPDKVIDASAMAALAFAEPEADFVLEEIDGYRLHAPELLVFELMNVAWKRAKKQPKATELFLEALDMLEGLSLRFRGIDQGEVVKLGLAEYRVQSFRIHDFTLPHAMMPRLIKSYSKGARPVGVADDALPLITPVHIGDVRINKGQITLYKVVR